MVFGFLSSVFGKPIILNAIKDAVIDERLSEIKTGKKAKVHLAGKANIKGGNTKFGKYLYDTYDIFRGFWVYPANIVSINILVISELFNAHYGFISQYALLSIYLVAYGFASLIIQTIAFIVNYKGRAVDHYYKELFFRK